MIRPVSRLGSLLTVAGAVGLMMFGPAIVRVFEGVLTYRIVQSPAPLPSSLVELRYAACSGIALTIGLVTSCMATATHGGGKTVSLAGKILHVGGGLMLLAGTVPLLWGILVAKRGFLVISTVPVAPKAEDLQVMVKAAAPILTIGSVLLLIASVMLLAGQAGSRTKAPQPSDTRSMRNVLVVVGSLVLGVVSSLLFVGVWLHGNTLEAFLAGSEGVKPYHLAMNLVGVLNKSLLAFIAVGCQGLLHAVAIIFVPPSTSDAGR